MDSSVSEMLATSVWKLFPFRVGNRAWLIVIVKAYLCCVFLGFCLACILNAVEGNKWMHHSWREGAGEAGEYARGDTALDECFWFIFTTMHGIGFGEFIARGVVGRLIAMFCCTVGYWFTIFLMCIVLLSQLPGEKAPSLLGVTSRMVSAMWPSYMVFLAIILAIGSVIGPYISRDHEGKNEWPSGMYWAWTTTHRSPYGDIWPDTVFGRFVTVPVACIGLLYMPYALACIAVRCPTFAQHREVVGRLRSSPDDALGRGYHEPPEAAGGGRSLQNFVMDDSYVAQDEEPEEQGGTMGRSCAVVCGLLTFTFCACIFAGGSPKTITRVVEHTLELDLPPGIRNAADPVPSIVWLFWLHDSPLEGTAMQTYTDIVTNMGAADIQAQLVTPDNLQLYNDTNFPMHKAYHFLSPNHKKDYLHAYFMQHYGGAYLPFKKTRNDTSAAAFDLIQSNETFYMAAVPSKEEIQCDESNVADAWCKELQFKADASALTFADTQIGVSSFDSSKGPCCAKVLDFYKANETQKHKFPKPEGFVMRKDTEFTNAWLDLVHKHLDGKLAELKTHTPPTEPCCVKKQEGYPLRWDELQGEIWSVLVKRHYKNIKFVDRVF